MLMQMYTLLARVARERLCVTRNQLNYSFLFIQCEVQLASQERRLRA